MTSADRILISVLAQIPSHLTRIRERTGRAVAEALAAGNGHGPDHAFWIAREEAAALVPACRVGPGNRRCPENRPGCECCQAWRLIRGERWDGGVGKWR